MCRMLPVNAVMNAWLPVGPRAATRPAAVSRAPFDAELAHYSRPEGRKYRRARKRIALFINPLEVDP